MYPWLNLQIRMLPFVTLGTPLPDPILSCPRPQLITVLLLPFSLQFQPRVFVLLNNVLSHFACFCFVFIIYFFEREGERESERAHA